MGGVNLTSLGNHCHHLSNGGGVGEGQGEGLATRGNDLEHNKRIVLSGRGREAMEQGERGWQCTLTERVVGFLAGLTAAKLTATARASLSCREGGRGWGGGGRGGGGGGWGGGQGQPESQSMVHLLLGYTPQTCLASSVVLSRSPKVTGAPSLLRCH